MYKLWAPLKVQKNRELFSISAIYIDSLDKNKIWYKNLLIEGIEAWR